MAANPLFRESDFPDLAAAAELLSIRSKKKSKTFAFHHDKEIQREKCDCPVVDKHAGPPPHIDESGYDSDSSSANTDLSSSSSLVMRANEDNLSELSFQMEDEIAEQDSYSDSPDYFNDYFHDDEVDEIDESSRFNDPFFEDCDAFEHNLLNSKRGGFQRSKKSTKLIHKLDHDHLRQLRRRKVKYCEKLCPYLDGNKGYRIAADYSSNGLETRSIDRKAARVAKLAAQNEFSYGGNGRSQYAAPNPYAYAANPYAYQGDNNNNNNNNAGLPQEFRVRQRAAPLVPAGFELRASANDRRARLLAELQHRELTPEDYEILLTLDESVAPKTVPKNVLDSLPTISCEDAHTSHHVSCSICISDFEPSDSIKRLPCGHVFHALCIDKWLSSSSRNCPMDNLPIFD